MIIIIITANDKDHGIISIYFPCQSPLWSAVDIAQSSCELCIFKDNKNVDFLSLRTFQTLFVLNLSAGWARFQFGVLMVDPLSSIFRLIYHYTLNQSSSRYSVLWSGALVLSWVLKSCRAVLRSEPRSFWKSWSRLLTVPFRRGSLTAYLGLHSPWPSPSACLITSQRTPSAKLDLRAVSFSSHPAPLPIGPQTLETLLFLSAFLIGGSWAFLLASARFAVFIIFNDENQI